MVLSEDTVIVTLHEALTPAEKDLARSPRGAARVQEFHRQLFANSIEAMREEIERITGRQVREAAAGVETATGAVVHVFTTGAMVQVFLLAQDTGTDRDSIEPADGDGFCETEGSACQCFVTAKNQGRIDGGSAVSAVVCRSRLPSGTTNVGLDSGTAVSAVILGGEHRAAVPSLNVRSDLQKFWRDVKAQVLSKSICFPGFKPYNGWSAEPK